MPHLRQAWPIPTHPRPIALIGAGAIVRTAHLPAYRRLGFPIAGIFDIRSDAAQETARAFSVPSVFVSLDQATAYRDAVFDVAVPGDQIESVVSRLPEGSAVLIQKPMGENLDAARRILAICRDRRLAAALNFQLRFSPNMLALTDVVKDGLGALTDIEVRIVDRQPWEQWSFLQGAPRLEVLYHSIHYLDAIRLLAGEPQGVYCRAVAHLSMTAFRDTRSSIILDYGDSLRCSLTLNHTHRADGRHRASMFKVEGTLGAAVLTMGVNLDYPSGPPDQLEIAIGS